MALGRNSKHKNFSSFLFGKSRMRLSGLLAVTGKGNEVKKSGV